MYIEADASHEQMQNLYIHVLPPHGEKHIDIRFDLKIKSVPNIKKDIWIFRPFKEPWLSSPVIRINIVP